MHNMTDKLTQREENLEDFIDEDEKSNDPSSSFPRTLKAYVKNIFMILFIGFLIFNAYYINDESQRAVETKFGKFIRITGPGLHFKLPFIESYQQYQLAIQRLVPKDKVSVPKDKVSVPKDSVGTASLDNYGLDGKIVLLYRLPDEQVEYIHRNIPDFKQLLEYLVKKIFKNKIGLINMGDMPNERDKLAKNILNELKQKLQDINLKIELYDFSMSYYDWPEEFMSDNQRIAARKYATRKAKSDYQIAQVVEEEVKIETGSKVNKTQADANVQQIKSQQIEMEIKKITAKVDAEIKKITAEYEAKAIEIRGKAQAEALKAQAQVLVENPRLVELEKIKRWDGKLPDCHKIQGILPFMSQTSTNTLPTTSLQQSSVVE